MNHEHSNSNRPTLHSGALAAVTVAAMVAVMTMTATDASANQRSGSNAPFPGWHQGFTHDADEWVGDEVDGEDGWCGSIRHEPRGSGDLSPSVGGGYAVATGGACNGYWSGVFGEQFRSGPFAGGTPLASAWPAGGYTMQTDVYLDPDATVDFDYYAAISLLPVRADEGSSASIQYFEVPVRSSDGSLTVDGHAVHTAGWYTFHHRFGEEDGDLTVEFALAARSGPTLFSTSVANASALGEEGPSTDDFAVEDVGSAYVWLHLGDEEELAIDRYQVRRGR